MKEQILLTVSAYFQHVNLVQLLPEVPCNSDKAGLNQKGHLAADRPPQAPATRQMAMAAGEEGVADTPASPAQSIVGRPRGGVRRYSPDLCASSHSPARCCVFYVASLCACACVCVCMTKKGH